MTKSRIFLALCLAFVVGVFTASLVDLSVQFAAAVFILGGLAATVGWYRPRARLIGFLAVVVAFGMWRYGTAYAARTDPDVLAPFVGKTATFAAIVVQPPAEFPNRTQLTVWVEAPREARGVKILATVRRQQAYRYGDVFELTGRMEIPGIINGFDYRSYLAKEGIAGTMLYPKTLRVGSGGGNPALAFLFGVRERFLQALHAVLPSPHGSLAGALIVGERASLPDELLGAFRRTGLTHIIAVSGFNFTIVIVALGYLLRWCAVPGRSQFWIIVAGILAFVFIAGATASVVRAATMGVLAHLATRAGRRYRTVNAIVFAGLVMLAVNPLLLRWDAGFQLSFLATLGLIFLGPLIAPAFQWVPTWLGLRETVVMTLAAQAAVLPLTASTFGQVSVIAPVANLLVVPLVPYTMAAAFAAGMVGWISSVAGVAAAFPAWLLVHYEIVLTAVFAWVPFASIPASIPIPVIVASYAVLVFVVWRISPRPVFPYAPRAALAQNVHELA
ncbi:ComEC/Rec2 family competence protein [Candidatus Parcubacteria bacterium]|nr:ComEC/Rec2 family competence protein [Candidatus Parcubacteria bacterium]